MIHQTQPFFWFPDWQRIIIIPIIFKIREIRDPISLTSLNKPGSVSQSAEG